MAQLHFTRDQIDDFGIIRDLTAEQLESVHDRLSQLSPIPLKAVELFACIRSALNGDDKSARGLMRICISLNGLMRQSSIDLDKVAPGVSSALSLESKWSESELVKWSEIEDTFKRLLGVRAFWLVAAVIDLSYEYTNLYRSGRILTDIRPLYSKDADFIEGAVVTYSLRLKFDCQDGSHEMNIAMDEEDVRDLSKQCGRALTKARTAQTLMQSKGSIPAIIAGEQGMKGDDVDE